MSLSARPEERPSPVENGIRQSEHAEDQGRRYAEAVIDSLREGVLILDPDLRVETANRSFYRLFGVEPEEAVGRRVYELGNGQWDLPRLRHLFEEVLVEGAVVEDFEVAHAFERIGQRTMLLNARRLGSADRVLLVIEDVTAQREAERRLRLSEERLQLLFENAKSYAIFLMDPEARITSWNPAAERMLGWAEADVLGRKADFIFTPEDRAAGAPARELEQARTGSDAEAEDERWHLRKGGERFWVNGRVVALWDKAGRLRGYAKVLRDLTEQKRYEEALEAANRELERSNEELEAFARTLAHEVRSPLSNVYLFFSLLEKKPHSLGERMRALAERAWATLQGVTEVMDNLLQHARVGGVAAAGVASSEEALEEALRDLAAEVEARGARVTHEPLPEVEADAVQLRQLFRNLLSNAVKYNASAEPRVHVAAERAGAGWRFRLSDNGIGVKEEDRERIFDLLERADEEDRAGTGIGLALCRRIVEGHGGRIWVEDGEGGGSAFLFTLPAAGDAAAQTDVQG